MNNQQIDLYLNLLKKALTYYIWGETESPIGIYGGSKKFKQLGGPIIVKLLARFNLKLMRNVNFEPKKREAGLDWPIKAHTMMGVKRLSNIEYCAKKVIEEGIPGDFIETGVWRGGGSIFMQGVLKAYGETDKRKLWVADSFEGLPPSNLEEYPQDSFDWSHMSHTLAVSLEEVQGNFRKYDLLEDNIVFLKGWFKDTLPKAPIEELAILRLDGDMYESTMDSLKNLYHKLNHGGFLIIDDYLVRCCLEAINDFRKENNVNDEIIMIDEVSAYWRKS